MQRIEEFKYDAKPEPKQKHRFIAKDFIEKINKKQFRDDLREPQLAFFYLTQLERVHTKASSKIKRLGRSLRDACLGKPRSFHSQCLMKSQLLEQVPARKIKTDMECEFSKGSEPRRRIEVFCQDGHGVMNVDFSDRFSGFRTHVVVTTVCTTGGVHTLTCCTHIFLHMARAQSHLHIFMRVTHTHGSSSWKKGVWRMSVLVLHLAFSLLMCHPSLLRPRWNLWLVWILCFARFSSWFWSSDRNQRKHASGNRLPEREERKKVLRSVLQSRCQNKGWRVFVSVWRVTENSFLESLTENSFLMDEISENILNEELNKLLLGQIQFRENISECVQDGYPEFEAKKFRIRIDWVTAWAWISKTTTSGSQSEQAQRERVHLCSELEMKDHLHQ